MSARTLVVLFTLVLGTAVAEVAYAHAGHAELVAMMAEYDAVRTALAGDDIPAGLAGAKKLTAAAQKAQAMVVARMKTPVGAIATASDALAKTEPDATKARVAFGEVSKQVVSYLAQDGGIAKDWLVFECSMAPGYGKWLQKSDKVANPYQGKAMLTCGSKSTL